MHCIKILTDLEEARLSPGVYRAARDALNTLIDAYAGGDGPYDPDLHGFIVVLDEPGDDEALRDVLGCSFLEATLEGASYDPENGCFVAVVLSNNEFGLTLIVLDSPDLDRRIRRKLIEELPEGEAAG
jgi:hypothetical protein